MLHSVGECEDRRLKINSRNRCDTFISLRDVDEISVCIDFSYCIQISQKGKFGTLIIKIRTGIHITGNSAFPALEKETVATIDSIWKKRALFVLHRVSRWLGNMDLRDLIHLAVDDHAERNRSTRLDHRVICIIADDDLIRRSDVRRSCDRIPDRYDRGDIVILKFDLPTICRRGTLVLDDYLDLSVVLPGSDRIV